MLFSKKSSIIIIYDKLSDMKDMKDFMLPETQFHSWWLMNIWSIDMVH